MVEPSRSKLQADRYINPDPQQREIARALYASIAHLPLVCSSGHAAGAGDIPRWEYAIDVTSGNAVGG